tara:strand:+ start:477 stop:752 length:276 start_codon:yes stop_codon:yes gene_type:complete
MEKIFPYSDSIVGSLCREIEYIQFRSKSINNSLANCQNNLLIIRLKKELNLLNKRIESIDSLSAKIKKSYSYQSFSIDLLTEMIGRTLINI